MNTPNSMREKSARPKDAPSVTRDTLYLHSNKQPTSASLLHTIEAAKLLRVSPALLARHRWAGTGMPYIRVGKRAVRYRLSDVQAWIENHAVTAASSNNGGNHV